MNVNTWAAVISAVVTVAGFLIDNWQGANWIWSELLRIVTFLLPLWIGLFAYGMYRLARFLMDLRQATKKHSEQLDKAFRDAADNKADILAAISAVEKKNNGNLVAEQQVRTSQDQSLSNEINRVDSRSRKMQNDLEALKAEVEELRRITIKRPPGMIGAALLGHSGGI